LWTRKGALRATRAHTCSCLGKGKVYADDGSDLIRQAQRTWADLRDSQPGEAMIKRDEKARYADRA